MPAPRITQFQQKVYSLTKKIPKGKVSTYKELGKAIGKKGMIYGAVGVALNRNPFAPKVPCHRIVSSDGSIGGFARGTKAKIQLLKKEGIEIKNNKIENFKKVLYRFK